MSKFKLLSDAKKAIDVLKDINKCPSCSYYLSLIQNHAKEGHSIDKGEIEALSP